MMLFRLTAIIYIGSAGLQSLEKKGKNEHPEAMPGNAETEKVTSAEFTRTLRFIESGGALRILRVLSKLCDESTYIRISNWLVFNASLSECMQFCYLILSMLTAHPKFAGIMDQMHTGPHNTATASSTARAYHEEKLGRYIFVHVCYHVYRIVCAPINKSVYISIPMFLSMSNRRFCEYLSMSFHMAIHMFTQCLDTFLYTCMCRFLLDWHVYICTDL